jgi:magnesium-transporting ATPase (P-type)
MLSPFKDGPQECKRCHKVFQLPWKLNRHTADCRKAGANRVIHARSAGPRGPEAGAEPQQLEFPCSICKNMLANREDLQKHLFLYHDNDEVKQHYNRGLKKLLNQKAKQRSRQTLLNMIRNNKFWTLATKVLRNRMDFSLEGINFNHISGSELDEES